MTQKEYEETTRRTTADEVEKLKNSVEYKQMMAAKGEDEAKWNWQVNERNMAVEEIKSPNKKNLGSISEDEDTAVENAVVRADAEIKEEKNFNVLTDDYKRKRVRFNSN